MTHSRRNATGTRWWVVARARARGRADMDGAAEAVIIDGSYVGGDIRGTVVEGEAPVADIDAFGGDLDAFFRYVGGDSIIDHPEIDDPRSGTSNTIASPAAAGHSLSPDSASLLRESGG